MNLVIGLFILAIIIPLISASKDSWHDGDYAFFASFSIFALALAIVLILMMFGVIT